jgi:hypothetical protein
MAPHLQLEVIFVFSAIILRHTLPALFSSVAGLEHEAEPARGDSIWDYCRSAEWAARVGYSEPPARRTACPLAVKSSENCSVDSLQACYDDQSIHVTLPRLKHKMLGTEFVEFSNAE